MKEATAGVHVRSHPLPYPNTLLRMIWPNQGFNAVAWARGATVTDLETHTPDDRWYELAGGGWVASAFMVGNAPGSTPL